MKKIFSLVSVAILISCGKSEKPVKTNSPATTFEAMKTAVINGDYAAFASQIDMDAIAVSQYQTKHPKASNADISKWKNSSDYKKAISGYQDFIKRETKQKNKARLARMALVNVTETGDTALATVQPFSDNPYLKVVWNFIRVNKDWKYSGLGNKGEPVDPPLKITAADLAREYSADLKKADEKFKGKVLSIKGVLLNVNKNATGESFAALKVSNPTDTIQCFLSGTDSNTAKTSSIKKGVTVFITGICDGITSKSVVIKECVVQ